VARSPALTDPAALAWCTGPRAPPSRGSVTPVTSVIWQAVANFEPPTNGFRVLVHLRSVVRWGLLGRL
jgi:hypothetical protein